MPGVQALSFCVEEFVDLQKEGQQFLGVLRIGGQFRRVPSTARGFPKQNLTPPYRSPIPHSVTRTGRFAVQL